MYVDYFHNESADDDATLCKELADAAKFTDADLQLNRAGKLSATQLIRLVFEGLWSFACLAGTAIGLVALGIGVMFYLRRMGGRPLMSIRLMQPMAIAVPALFFGLIAFVVKLLFSLHREFKLMRDLMEGNVTSVSGRLTTSVSEEIEEGLDTIIGRKTEHFNCVVKGEYFHVTREAFELLRDRSGSMNYQVYVTPRSRYLVAMEKASG